MISATRLVAICVLLFSLVAHAQENTVTMRATTARVTDAAVKFIARNAAPTRPETLDFKTTQSLTPKELITRLCGSVTEAYYKEFLAMNGLPTLNRDEPLRENARRLVWPACLYIKPAAETVVRQAERMEAVYSRATGKDIVSIFSHGLFSKQATKSVKVNKEVPRGEVVRVPYQTAATEFRTKLPPDAFARGVTKAAAGANVASAEPVVRRTQDAAGEIILGVGKPMPAPAAAPAPTAPSTAASATLASGETAPSSGAATPPSPDLIASGMTASEPNECIPFPEPPYDAGAVVRAYQHSMEHSDARGAPGQAHVVVVDNGFFGADTRSIGKEFAGSPFDASYFKPDRFSLIAQRLMMEQVVFPINYAHGLKPDPISGHGTHVTGLVLGGPWFVEARDKLYSAGSKWAELTIVNVGKGARTLVNNAQRQLMEILSGGTDQIVNMSIAYTGDQDIQSVFDRLFQVGQNRLFIASAGNESRNVTENRIYPAAFGGPGSPNVITVAALDGSGEVPKFSNRGTRAVDMAAPGCEIRSWLSNTKDETPLTGTSQAAPLVTFTAALLRSLVPLSEVRDIKARLITAGDLLRPTGANVSATAYRVSLNVPKSLYWFEDYVRLTGERAGEYLGRVLVLDPMRCTGSEEMNNQNDVWAYKRDVAGGHLFTGKSTHKVHTPCPALDKDAQLQFVPTLRITKQGYEAIGGTTWTLPLTQVEDLVFKTYR